MLKIILVGAAGRMGEMVTSTSLNDPQVEIIAGVDQVKGTGNYQYYPSFDQLGQISSDVIIDFSVPQVLKTLLNWAVDHQVPIVIAQTKLSPEDHLLIKQASEKIAIFMAPNLAFNVLLFKQIVIEATKRLADFDIEIIERHHRDKLDAPSGTALAIFEAINQVLPEKYPNFDRHTSGKRDPNEIGIQAIRGGHIIGDHQVIFANDDEIIEIKHQAISRSIFAKGAISAAKFIATQTAGLYYVEDLWKGFKNND